MSNAHSPLNKTDHTCGIVVLDDGKLTWNIKRKKTFRYRKPKFYNEKSSLDNRKLTLDNEQPSLDNIKTTFYKQWTIKEQHSTIKNPLLENEKPVL